MPSIVRRGVVLAAAATTLALGAPGCSSSDPGVAPEPTTSTITGATANASSLPAATATRTSVPGTTARTAPASPSGTVGTAAPRSSATITKFDMASTIACHGLVHVTLTARYTTSGATTVAFLVDNEQVNGAPPVNGSFDLPLACDGSTHTIVLSAIDEQGRSAVQSKAVLTDDTESGG